MRQTPEERLREMGNRNRALFVRVNILEQTLKTFIKWLKFPNRNHFSAIEKTCKNLLKKES